MTRRVRTPASELGDRIRAFAAAYAANGQREHADGMVQAALTVDAALAGTSTGLVDDPLALALQAAVESLTRVANQLTEVAADLASSVADAPPTKPATVAHPEKRPERSQVRSTGDRPRGQRRILETLGRHGACSKAKLAILTGYAVGGGGFNNYLGSLRSAGLVDGSDPVQLTATGRGEVADEAPTLPSDQELFEEWLRHPQLGRAHREIMRVLRENQRPMSKEEVADRCDPPYEPNGGGFNNAVGRLRTLGIVVGHGRIELAEELRKR